ncbi:GNAT family acetyltransferase [[Clostridium] sordellii]|uniref:GNAT family N-acetyltransferase n=1 Tax=Paraclostridium sordellii TaxID=1505 RepID=UPI0005E37541|nr:GNAT family N-acetyltransferase [Paeniclostridium sordellii]MDU4415296.1 GNAT family N-acetyltransferase [Paeniclostridium sordellii]MDU6483257.1 GNAT family N-acetyltransferase [Paeniclostridium sordellii]MRZ28625.1 GNAT family N-acetyltransferase [Paeniclostridium sordellii]MVO74488.1 GNAT family N-acetyltransferase [Paeniclostridium sordellii]CEN23642.1 GNAT family acetyltransferase [[Clostridium] sordellii] [Paeniclostridium sordellii]
MKDIKIRKLSKVDEIPYKLLYSADPSIESVNDYLDRGDCYIAYNNDEVLGVYVLIKTRPSILEIVNIAVEESYQGSGIGKKLVASAIDKARELKVKTLEVGTGNSSISQLAFYQKCGFRIVGVDKNFFKKHYKEKIEENGIKCIDMIRLSIDL